MLKLRNYYLAMILALSSPVSMAAEEPVKLGVVNVALLLEQAPQAKSATAKLEKEFAPQQAELKKLGANLEKLQNDYQKNKTVMSDAQKISKEREIALLTREIQRRRNDVQELLNLRRNEELAKLQKLVNESIKKIGSQQGFDLILYEGIAYTNKRIDVTEDVLKHLSELSQKQRTEFNQ
ncbi:MULTISPECIES: OmpH family outer membrane protein [Thiomicrorhabdus]|uniref:OmpH family outer membrane protein n=1 Tax=Thiomicrorhabdus heinhorstiae TaxID=2748010 RepID=A0ABS0BXW6_9GAMM|nr:MULTISPECIES: OmpH family outer membrane protein [Thiomicrorhabdus]MBF6056821.1 OmpH family outer membrane protein [Thiomicrorhabdus heinhorstiae]